MKFAVIPLLLVALTCSVSAAQAQSPLAPLAQVLSGRAIDCNKQKPGSNYHCWVNTHNGRPNTEFCSTAQTEHETQAHIRLIYGSQATAVCTRIN